MSGPRRLAGGQRSLMSNDFQSLAQEVGYTQAETVMAPVRSRDALVPTVTNLLAPLKDRARRNFAWVKRVVFARLPWLPLPEAPNAWYRWSHKPVGHHQASGADVTGHLN